jgi:hypothetical protein
MSLFKLNTIYRSLDLLRETVSTLTRPLYVTYSNMCETTWPWPSMRWIASMDIQYFLYDTPDTDPCRRRYIDVKPRRSNAMS